MPSIAKVLSNEASGPPPSILTGLDLATLSVSDTLVSAKLPEQRLAHLTVDPTLQRIAERVMSMHHVPEASVVLMDVQTGKILVYANHIEKGPPRDLAVEATAPAASVFKIVTAAALVEQAGATAEQRECYSGGEQRLVEKDLVSDPKRDKWCTTLGGAMGRSINTVFARLALKHLNPKLLESEAQAFRFGTNLPFDVPVQPSAEHFPQDSLGFARTSAGFWNTTLSPVHAAWISAMVARGGEPIRPMVVNEVVDPQGKILWTAKAGIVQKRVLKPRTAEALTTMMDTTVTDGTSYRAFHDPKGQSFLPNVSVAGKTGTLTDPTTARLYTWFTGFAPSHPVVLEGNDTDGNVSPRQVAIGVLVVNQPTWTIKANVLAREVLRAYLASQGVPNVTTPTVHRAAQPATAPGTKQRRQRGS